MPYTLPLPDHKRSYCSSVRSAMALCTGKSIDLAPFTNCSLHQPNFSPFHGATAPSYTLNLLSGITRSESIPKTWLNPSQVGQAPNGLLKLKRFGVGSSNCIPSNSNRLLK